MLLLLLACAHPTPASADTELVCAHDPPLHGTLVGTSGPVVVVVVGAQMWDRWGDLPDKKWGHYRDITHALADAGASAYTFDKGGTGATGGEPQDLDGRVGELLAAVTCVRAARPTAPIVLLGHSQGAAVVAAAAAQVAPAAVVLLNPAVAPPAGAVVLQDDAEARPEWNPIVIPGADHLLFPSPAVAGVTHVDPRALDAIVHAVLAAG